MNTPSIDRLERNVEASAIFNNLQNVKNPSWTVLLPVEICVSINGQLTRTINVSRLLYLRFMHTLTIKNRFTDSAGPQ